MPAQLVVFNRAVLAALLLLTTSISGPVLAQVRLGCARADWQK